MCVTLTLQRDEERDSAIEHYKRVRDMTLLQRSADKQARYLQQVTQRGIMLEVQAARSCMQLDVAARREVPCFAI